MNNQLSFFQDLEDFEKNIFNRAKSIKDIVQKLYIANIVFPKEQENDSYAILTISIEYDQVHDKDTYEGHEPNVTRTSIWRFSPSIKLTVKGKQPITIFNNGEFSADFKDEDLVHLVGNKVIPKLFNDFYTKRIFSPNQLLQLATQLFTSDLLKHILTNKNFIEKLNTIIDTKELIIYFESKLFINALPKTDSADGKDIINSIKSNYNYLKKIQKSHWYYISNCTDFLNENDLLSELDKNNDVKIEITKRAIFDVNKEFNQFTTLFQDDYLFLNNIDFFRKKHNTDNWNCDCILPPYILNNNFAIDQNTFPFRKNDRNQNRNIYCYIKGGFREPFSRNEILFPDKEISQNTFLNIIRLAKVLKDEAN